MATLKTSKKPSSREVVDRKDEEVRDNDWKVCLATPQGEEGIEGHSRECEECCS